MKLNIKARNLLYLKDRRDMVVKQIVSPGERFLVRDVDDSKSAKEEVTLDAINSVHETYIKIGG